MLGPDPGHAGKDRSRVRARPRDGGTAKNAMRLSTAGEAGDRAEGARAASARLCDLFGAACMINDDDDNDIRFTLSYHFVSWVLFLC